MQEIFKLIGATPVLPGVDEENDSESDYNDFELSWI